MFTKRIIPCLDVHNGRVVKGVNFVNLRDAGDPVEIGAAYGRAGADELVFLDIRQGSRLFAGVSSGEYVYFVHSYYLKAEDEAVVAASTEYSTHIHAAVEAGSLWGCQFHPEKSGDTGLRILKNFVEL